MSLDNITTLAGHFASYTELQKYCDTQYLAVEVASKRILQLEEEVKHLKSLLTSTTPTLLEDKIETIVVSTEQSICEMEIEKLYKVSMQRSLTLEETKRLDLLVKNLYLVKTSGKDINADFEKLPKNITEAQLLSIAASTSIDGA